MRNVLILASVMIVVFSGMPAFAQHPAEIGVDAGWTGFDEDVTNGNGWRVGFRAGVYVWDWIQLEGQVAGSRASEKAGTVDLDSTLLTAVVNGVFNLRKRKWIPYALVGIGGANLQVTPGISSFSDFGLAWQVGGGTRFMVTKNMAIRGETIFLREKTFDLWNGHWNVTGGVSWTFGEK
jgi:opacity protein-like surface antigen